MMDGGKPERFDLLSVEMAAHVDDVGDSAGIAFIGEDWADVDHEGFVGVLHLTGDGKAPHFTAENKVGWYLRHPTIRPELMPYEVMIEMDPGSWVKCNGRFRISVKLNPEFISPADQECKG